MVNRRDFYLGCALQSTIERNVNYMLFACGIEYLLNAAHHTKTAM